jgi:hypothetical protein
MKLARLKAITHSLWLELAEFNDAIPQPNGFNREVRALFGDLRCRATWEAALVRFYAQMANLCCLDAWYVIVFHLNFNADSPYYPYRHAIFEEFLTYANSLDLIKTGLEQIFNSSDFTPQERQEAQHNGFFAMVHEQSAGGILDGRAAEFARLLPAAG